MNILKLIFDPIVSKMVFTKKNLIKNKRETVLGMILDREVEIEVNWLLLRKAEDGLKETRKKIEKNCDLIKAGRSADKIDLEKIKKLTAENVSLGFKDVDESGKTSYRAYTSDNPKRRKQTECGKFENRIEAQMAGITQSVLSREMLKQQLKAINRMIKGGFRKNFDKFRNEELDFVLES